ncbi:putative fimbrial protein SteD [Serratia fonticola]|jgi:hypothetical protein|nr:MULTISPECIES: hypothetical protein [Serratia]AYM91971.1 hypothetical protein D9980_16105 [Serratia sp. 3ACOL1]CAI1951271.1 putative fimbrial protein SteD [Serratia fonticola]
MTGKKDGRWQGRFGSAELKYYGTLGGLALMVPLTLGVMLWLLPSAQATVDNWVVEGANGTLYVHVGPVTAFDSTVLWTNKNGLGIQLLQGSTKLPVNTWLNFTYPNKPELWSVPVKPSWVTLKGGEFAAGATMKVDYQ